MDMITEHNYGVQIPLSHDDHSSHMDDIHTEMEKRLIVFLALPGNTANIEKRLRSLDLSYSDYSADLTGTIFVKNYGLEVPKNMVLSGVHTVPE